MQYIRSLLTLCLVLLILTQTNAQARYALEAAESVIQRFGGSVARTGARSLATKIEQCVVRYGEGFLPALNRVGPRAFTVLEEVGASQASRALRVMAEHGETGIVNLLSRPKAIELAARLGAPAERVMLQHPVIGEMTLERLGQPAIGALNQIGPQAARRLAMLTESGEFSRFARSEEVLSLIGKYGDKAMKFIWENKGALVVTGAMTAFLANPEPFLEGTVKLTSEVITSAVKPLAEIPKVVAEQAAASINWTLVVMTLIGILSGWLGWKYWRHQKKPQPNVS